MIEIRKSTHDDIPFLVESNYCMAKETEEKELNRLVLEQGVRAVLDDPAKGQYWLACKTGAPIGQLMITLEWSDWRNGWFWWVQSVYVLPACRREGVFRSLWQSLITRALAHQEQNGEKVVGIRLYVEKENYRAAKVYQSVGMVDASYYVYEWLNQ